MPKPSGLAHPAKKSFGLVRFRFGNPDPQFSTYERFTDADRDLTIEGDVFSSRPDMEITVPAMTGSFDEQPAFVDTKIGGNAFLEALSSGCPHSPVEMTLRAMIFAPDRPDGQQFTLFRGRVSKTIRNYQGQSDLVRIEALPAKQKLPVPLGVLVNHQCAWVFASSKGCTESLTTHGNVVSAIDGTVVTLQDSTAAFADRLFHRGYMEREGLRILIRDWESGQDFKLVRRPPDEWLNNSVSVASGCDKTIETCRNVHDNEANFGGFGYAMPAYNPNFEAS